MIAIITFMIIMIMSITLQMSVLDRNHWRSGFPVSMLFVDTRLQLLVMMLMHMLMLIIMLIMIMIMMIMVMMMRRRRKKMKMVNDITWFQKEAGEVVKGGTSEVTMVGSVLLTIIIIIMRTRLYGGGKRPALIG